MIHIRQVLDSSTKKAGVAAVLVAVIAAVVVLTISLTTRDGATHDSTAASRARTTLGAVPAACDDLRGQTPIAVPGLMEVVRGSGKTSPFSESIALLDRCTDLKRGGELSKLDQTAFVWNAQCVTDLGGKLRAGRNPSTGDDSDVLPEPNGDVSPSKYAQCVTFSATAQDCEQYRAAFDAIGLSVRQTAILEKLGCHNTEVRIPAAG